MDKRPEFHIHIDAAWIAAGFENALLRDYGFYAMDFDHGSPEDSGHAPERHMTLKVFDPVGFKATFHAVSSLAQSSGGMRGYIEGEFVSINETIVGGPLASQAVLPFRFSTRPLADGSFRESEIHVTFRRSAPAAVVRTALQAAGFFSAALPKPDGIAQVFTAQGSRRDIARIVPLVVDFLRAVGGFELVKVKEERIARWWMSSPDLPLPPVIDQIEELPALNGLGI
jgi:hypothetical protein